MKKLLAIVISMAMIVAMMPMGVFATDETSIEYWSSITEKPEGYNEDITSKTINISSAEGLAWFAKQINTWESQEESARVDFKGYTINITNDIDLSGKLWTPIDTATVITDETNNGYKNDRAGTYNNKLLDKAVINGNGHTIIGLTVKNTVRGPKDGSVTSDGQSCYYYAAFVGRSNGDLTINGLSFSNADINGENEPYISKQGVSTLAVVVGYNGGNLSLNNVTLNNCVVSGYTKIGGFTGNGGTLNLVDCEVSNSTFELVPFYVDEEIAIAEFAAPIAGYIGKDNLKVDKIILKNNIIRNLNPDNVISWENKDKFGNPLQWYIYEYNGEYDADCLATYTAYIVTYRKSADNSIMMVGPSDGKQGRAYGDDYRFEATNGNTYYKTFDNAVANAKVGDTITLYDEFVLEADKSIDRAINLKINADVTGEAGFVLANGAKITANNGVLVKAKGVDDSKYIELESNKTYVVENGKLTVYVPYVPSIPSTPADNVTNNTTDKNTTADLTPAVSDNKSTTTVDNATADKIVDKAVANKSTEVIVDATGNNTVASSEVAIPEKTVKELAEKTDANLVIKTDNGQVDLDKTALAAVAEQAGTTGTVRLVVETVKTDENICHVDLKLITSNGAVKDFRGGNVKVTIDLDKELAAKELVCVYIDDNGIYTLVEGVLNADGTYTFVTGHFSEYAVMAKDEADKVIANQLNTLVKEVNLKVRTSKTSKKNIKAVVSGDVKAITDAGYTVKYKFYRSTKKASKYAVLKTKADNTYINTKGKKGTKYYYKAKALVYQGDKLVGQTVLKQCKYGARTWSK